MDRAALIELSRKKIIPPFTLLPTLLTFVGLVGKTTPPAAIGTPYVKE